MLKYVLKKIELGPLRVHGDGYHRTTDDIFDLLSHVFTFQVAPLLEHYLDFANLAGKVAER